MADALHRPVGVTIVAVIAWIAGALDLVAGVLKFFALIYPSVVEQYGGSGALIAAGIGQVIVGLITVVVAGGLLNGSQVSRMIITVVRALSLIGSLFLAVAYMGSPTALAEWLSLLASFIILILLWTRKASEYFNAKSRESQSA